MKFDATAFIEAVKERPPIWVSKHALRHRRPRLWDEIGDMFPQFKVEELKKKWKNFKDAYRREYKKNPDPLYVQWQHFSHLEFLKDEITSTLDTAESNQNESQLEFEYETETNTEDFDEETHAEDVKPYSLFQQTLPPLESQSTSSQQPTSSNSYGSRKRENSNDLREEYLEMKKKLKSLEQEVALSEEINQEGSKSGDYYFLMSILPEMEKLPPLKKLRFRNKINEALIDEMKIRGDE